MVAHQSGEPLVQRRGSGGVPPADDFDPSADFADDQHTEEQMRIGDFGEPCRNVRMAPAALAQLREDVGVEQIGHNRTARGRRRLRPKSLSVPASGILSSHSLRVVVRTDGRRAARKIERCSASIECPRRAAWVRRAATTSGSRFRTMSCDPFFRFMLSTIARSEDVHDRPSQRSRGRPSAPWTRARRPCVYVMRPSAGAGSLRNPGKRIVVEGRSRWRIATSEKSTRKSVVTAKSRPSKSCSRARPGHRP